MEGLLNGTADPIDEVTANQLGTRQAEKRRRKEEKALMREMKRQKRLSKAAVQNGMTNEEEEVRIEQGITHHDEASERDEGMSTPVSIVNPILDGTSPTQPRSSPSASPKADLNAMAQPGTLPATDQLMRLSYAATPEPVLPSPTKIRKTFGKPKVPLTSGSSSSTPRARRKKAEKPTDEELRSRFSTPGAMNAYISGKWVALGELKRLADAGSTSPLHPPRNSWC